MRKLSSFVLVSVVLTACATSPASPASPVPTIPSLIIPTPPACTTIVAAPTPGADTPSLFPPESAKDHVRGAKSATVTITEYSDYQDLRSGLFEEVVNRLLEEHQMMCTW
jgi:hypothetical protein